MRRFLLFLILTGILLAYSAGSYAEEAAMICPKKISADVSDSMTPMLFDESYFTIWYAKRGEIRIELPEDQPAYHLYLCFYRQAIPIIIQVPDGDGGYRDEVTVSDPYLHQAVELPGVTSIRIRIADESKKEMLRLAELRFYGKGQLPDDVQTWQMTEKADMLIISGHPDDELLWYGGTIPVYAGERRLHVQLVYFTHGDYWRENELLDGLWMCGVRDYPIIGEFPDNRTESAADIFRNWGGGKKTVFPWLIEIIRRLKPEVVLTHDIAGEYGHGVHRVAASAAINCFTLAADETFAPESAAAYGVWQVKKLYVHMYRENTIRMDWDQPLAVFGGKTGMEVSNAALQCHKSQQPIGFYAAYHAPYDCRDFGLYATTVGPDVLKNDFLENISLQDSE